MSAPALDESKGGAAVGGNAILGQFFGTGNQRHLRAIQALLRGPVARIDLDDIIGCTNAPYVIQELRGMGLEVPCERLAVKDRDGRTCHPGRYRLTDADRAKVHCWLRGSGAEPLDVGAGGKGG